MISTIEELLDDVFYDWGFCPDPQIKKTNQPIGFVINKTYIFEREGKFFLNYKTDEAPIEEDVFLKFSKLYNDYYSDPLIAEKLNKFSNSFDLKNDQEFKDFIKKY